MRSLERASKREPLDKAIQNIAAAYGFSSPALSLSRRAITDQGEVDHHVAAIMALVNTTTAAPTRPTQIWGVAKKGGGSTLTFSVTGGKHAVAHALIVKTALSIAEQAGFDECAVGVSSVGDHESRRRFTRELTSFFKKNMELLAGDMRTQAARDPDATYRALLGSDDPLRERLPRPIDYLSENSRKIMTDTLALFESVGIAYALTPHLPVAPGVQSELQFAISGVLKGERMIIAQGGRFDEVLKKKVGQAAPAAGIALTLPQEVDMDDELEVPACFVVHVGEAARLKAFTLLDGMWRAKVSVREALMAETLKEQIERSKELGVPYVVIIGQREAIDGTAIVRSTVTQMQTAMPVEKLIAAVTRARK